MNIKFIIQINVIARVIINEPNPILINLWIDGNNIVATSGFSSYQWFLSDGTLIPGATSNIFEPSSKKQTKVLGLL